MLHVECFNCHTSAYTENVADPDSALECPADSDCCKEDHHHGEAANGGVPCRPVRITVMPGSVTLQRANA